MSDKFSHIPVLLKESIDLLDPQNHKTYVDCTLGGGGHAAEIKRRAPDCRLIGIDADTDAIEASIVRLAEYKNVKIVKDNFKNLKNIIQEPVDGLLFDLGISSYQIDEAARGFSLQLDGPLDMRMDRSQALTAHEIANKFKQKELERIFKDFGEEKFWHRIAKAVVYARRREELKSTRQLKTIIEKAIPTWRKRETVTRIFQALRIAVNFELDSLQNALNQALDLIVPQGRLAVIAYHSLEDRIVKHTLRRAAAEKRVEILTKKPLLASDEETAVNSRSKSAKLRGARKI